MVSEYIRNMTNQEFKQWVFELVDERLRDKYPYVQRSDRPVAEILKSVQENIWKPRRAQNPALNYSVRIVTDE